MLSWSRERKRLDSLVNKKVEKVKEIYYFTITMRERRVSVFIAQRRGNKEQSALSVKTAVLNCRTFPLKLDTNSRYLLLLA